MPDHNSASQCDLAILIVSWNTCDLLRDCLVSIHEQTYRYTYEIWIVDNNSSDGTVEMVQHEFPEVNLIANRENRGFARANNQAFAQSVGRYAALLNPDTVLLNDAFDKMLDYLENHVDCGAVGPKLLNPDGTFQGVCARRAPNLQSEFARALRGYRSRTVLTEENQHISRDVEVVSGACVVVRRDLFETSILNETYFMYVEDLELCWYVRERAHKRVYYLSDAHVLHLHGQSAKQAQAQNLRVEISYGMYHHLKKSRGIIVASLSRLFAFVGALLRLPKGFIYRLRGDWTAARTYWGNMFAVMLWAIGLNRSVGKNKQ